MNFGDILDEWEAETAKPRGKPKRKTAPGNTAAAGNSSVKPSVPDRPGKDSCLPKANPLDVWLRRYGTVDKDAEPEHEEEAPHEKRRRLRAMKTEAQIDLHGLTRDEAWIRLEAFFTDCVRMNLSKVLIIHGKGTHSEDDPVLRTTVKHFLEMNPHAGESGYSSNRHGGSGSTWVILK